MNSATITNMWSVETVSGADSEVIRDSIYKLSDNTMAAMRIPDVYAAEEVDTIVYNIDRQGVSWYPNFEFKQGRIGICATEYASKINGKEAYFMLEADASKTRNEMFPGDLDPVGKMVDTFSPSFDTSVAEESSVGHARYFTGLVRAMGQESTTHFDFAPHQLPGWQVAASEAQFAVVTYLQVPAEGGELTIFNRPWEQNVDEFNKDVEEKGPQGFEGHFLDEAESVLVAPNPGEMVVFNSRNFHKVEGMISQAARYSINSFMSLSDDKLRLWN